MGTKTKTLTISLTMILSILTGACNQNQEGNNSNLPRETPQKSLFFCEKNTEKTEPETWSVIYNKNTSEFNPWLHLNKLNIKTDNLEKSCQEIAQTLDKLNQEGLFQLSYQIAPENNKDYLLCAQTKSNPNNCNLIVTLNVQENIDKTFQEIAEPLFQAGETYQKVSGGTSVTYSAQEVSNSINLTPHLLKDNP